MQKLEFQKFVADFFHAPLAEHGFPTPPKSRWNSFRRTVANRITQHISLTSRVNTIGQRWVIVSAGVRLPEAQDLYSTATGCMRELSTLGGPLSFLTGKDLTREDKCPFQWHLRSNEDLALVAADMLFWIREVAFSFVDRFQSSAEVESTLRSEEIKDWYGNTRVHRTGLLAAILASSDRRDEAIQLLRTEFSLVRMTEKDRYPLERLLSYITSNVSTEFA